MDSQSYMEYAFYLGSKDVGRLLDEAEMLGLDVPQHLVTAEDIRSFILQKVC